MRFIILLIALCAFSPAFAQDTKIIEAAKKEGRIVLYGTMQSDIFEQLQKAFQKKTGITIDYWRTSATKVMERVLSETRAGKSLFDLVMSTEDTTRIMLKEGILAKYDSPMNKDFPKDAIDPQLGPRARNHIVGIVYNKSMIKAADAPKSLEDIVKPHYRGKLVMAKAGEFVNRKGVYPPVPDADKIQFVEMDDLGEKIYAEKRREFQKLFLR